ncbi:hypothetical protein [Spirosoma lituiforme]
MNVIDVDEAVELTIRCKANRTFDLVVNLNRDTTGKTYKLDVRDSSDALLLSFVSGQGMTQQPQAVKLSKSPSEMEQPTGCYRYDLVEIDANQGAENIFFGWFIIQPSHTQL